VKKKEDFKKPTAICGGKAWGSARVKKITQKKKGPANTKEIVPRKGRRAMMVPRKPTAEKGGHTLGSYKEITTISFVSAKKGKQYKATMIGGEEQALRPSSRGRN